MKIKKIRAVIAAICVVTAFPSWAADRHWNTSKVGGSEASPYDIWTTTNWDGSIGSGHQLHFAVSEKTYIESKSSTQVGNDFNVDSGDFVFIGPLSFLCYKSSLANATSTVVKKGDWTIKDYGLLIGSGSGTTVTFTNESGNVSITGSRDNNSILSVASGENSTVTVVKEAGDWSVSKTFFIGNGSGSIGRFYNCGGNVSGMSLYGVCLGSGSGNARNAYLEISGGRITNTGGHLNIGDGDNNGSSMVYVTGDGEYFAQSGYVLVGVCGKAILTIDQKGFVKASARGVQFCDAAKCVAGRDCFLNLNGGMLETTSVTYGSGTAAATFTFNGGTLKALQEGTLIAAHANLAVKIGANGGIIDANGLPVALNEPILEDLESTGGGMMFKGGGMVTLAAGNTYTGLTTVEVGTTVLIPESGTVAGGLAVTVPSMTPGDGVYALLSITGEGTFPANVLTGVAAPTGSRLVLSGDAKTILCVYGNPDPAWIGGASGSLSVGAHWSTGVVPTSGNCVIGNHTEANLTVGDTFAATSITFPADTGLVTISGENAISGITAITNNAPFHHVFNCPVICADGLTPDITRTETAYMTFAGGITMHDAPKTGATVYDFWSGNIMIVTDAEQKYITNGTYGFLVSGTTFAFKNGTIDHLFIDAGATAVVERLVYNDCVRGVPSGKNAGYFNNVFDNGNGTIRTKEVKSTGDAVLFHSYAGPDMVGGTIIAEKLTCAATRQTGGAFQYPVFMLNCGGLNGNIVSKGDDNGEGVWVIGPGGLAFGETIHTRAYFDISIGKSLGGRPAARLHSYADWALQESPNGVDRTALTIGGNYGGFLVIDTSHYAIGDAAYDSAKSHTVTLNGSVVGSGMMRVEGNGKIVFANKHNGFSDLTVNDTATASVKAGCRPGTGAVTLAAGTTFEVAESGTATIDGALTLAEGAALAFNFTDKTAAPVLAVATISTLPATVNVKVSSADGVRPNGGRYVLTLGGVFAGVNVSLAEGHPDWAKGVSVNTDGNIVLDVKNTGMMVIVK